MEASKRGRKMSLNIPNQITVIRLVVSLFVFVLIPLQQYLAALACFVVAAATDWTDGYIARKYNLVTKLGRILDPFADKILICGAFIFLAAETGSGVTPWMAVVVVGRELLVTALRGFIEEQGGDFSAQMAGKLKMVFQCLSVVISLWLLSHAMAERPGWLTQAAHWAAWVAVISTVYSGVGYVISAARLLRG